MSRIRGAGWGLAVIVFIIGLSSGPAFGEAPLTTTQIVSGLERPVFCGSPPGDTTRLFVLLKRGIIRLITISESGYTLLPDPFLDIDSLVINPIFGDSDERGLLGLAFHPNYENNGFFYVNYINNSGDTVIARYTRSAGNHNVADSGSAQIVMTYTQPNSNHNGGWLGFGPNDGYLHIASGDGGSSCDPGQRAQNLTLMLGKMLRIDVDGNDFPADPNRNYAIPPSNPFVGVSGNDEIWAYGLRNPWRPSFDRMNGDFYIADVGQGHREEINYQSASSTGGENYGWDCLEGTLCFTNPISDCFGTTAGCACNNPSLVPPIHEYGHDAAGGCSITGGYVYRGAAIPSLQGAYFFADYCTAIIWSIRVVGGAATELTVRTSELDPPGALFIDRIVSFGEDASGEMYIVDQGGQGATTGQIFKIIANCLIKITQHPMSQSVCEGETVQFTSSVGGDVPPTTFIWRKNGVPIGAPNNSTLTLTNVTPADAGDYDVYVEDQCNIAVSHVATLAVTPLPLGDINGDCVVDSIDAALLADVLLEIETNPVYVSRSDVNGDSFVNGDDIQAFVDEVIP